MIDVRGKCLSKYGLLWVIIAIECLKHFQCRLADISCKGFLEAKNKPIIILLRSGILFNYSLSRIVDLFLAWRLSNQSAEALNLKASAVYPKCPICFGWCSQPLTYHYWSSHVPYLSEICIISIRIPACTQAWIVDVFVCACMRLISICICSH